MARDQFIPLYDLALILEEYLNCSNILDCCPNGVQVEGSRVIKKAATAVSANLMTLELAVKEGVDALIVHHGIFWKGDEFPIKGTLKEKIKLLLDHGISLLAYHLPLDLHREIGNNWRVAIELGWENLLPFHQYNGQLIGVVGRFPSILMSTFMAELEAYYSHPAAHALGGKKEISSAALVSGGGYKLLKEAVSAGVDCFITGNYDEPAWGLAHEEKINFLALGHSATERVGPKALASYIEVSLGVPCKFLDLPNPF